MKRSSFLLCALLMALSAPSLFAADVTGTWTGTLSTPNGEATVTYKFNQDGEKLTGTVTGPQGNSAEITDGRVDNNKLSFSVAVNETVALKHEGTIDGGEIKLTLKSDRGDFPITLKRST